MRVFCQSNQQAIGLGAARELGAGGEARVYAVPGSDALVAKIYHRPTEAYERKLAWMIAHPPDDLSAASGEVSIAWPLDLLLDGRRRFTGLLAPRVAGGYTLFECYNPATRRVRCPLFDYRDLHRAARNLAAAVHTLHRAGYLIGDVNESNILVSDRGRVTLVDTDSFQVRESGGSVHRCVVGKPEFTPPELQGKNFADVDRAPEHDRFGLGVLLFLLLMEGRHPFASAPSGAKDPPPVEARIRSGSFPYSPEGAGEIRPPRTALPFGILHPRLQELFVRCFDVGHRDPPSRPDAAEWTAALEEAERDLVTCAANLQHQHGSHLPHCLWCTRAKQLGGRDPFPSREAVARDAHLPARRPARLRSRVHPRGARPRPPPSPAPRVVPVHSVAWYQAPRNWAWLGVVLSVLALLLPPLRAMMGAAGVLCAAAAWRRAGSITAAGAPQTLGALWFGGIMLLSVVVPHVGPESASVRPAEPTPSSLEQPVASPKAEAPDRTGDSTYDVAAVSEVPRLLNAAEIQEALTSAYPPLLRDAGVTGSSVVAFVIGTDGNVEPGSVSAVSSTHFAFASAAESIVKRMKFTPATVNGTPVRVRVTQPITWQLER